jgi:hypothetical protein
MSNVPQESAPVRNQMPMQVRQLSSAEAIRVANEQMARRPYALVAEEHEKSRAGRERDSERLGDEPRHDRP